MCFCCMMYKRTLRLSLANALIAVTLLRHQPFLCFSLIIVVAFTAPWFLCFALLVWILRRFVLNVTYCVCALSASLRPGISVSVDALDWKKDPSVHFILLHFASPVRVFSWLTTMFSFSHQKYNHFHMPTFIVIVIFLRESFVYLKGSCV